MSAYEKFLPQDKLATARLAARNRWPYFGAALMGLIPKDAGAQLRPAGVPIAVTKSMQLLIDWDEVTKWTCEEFEAVLVHEVMHVVREHHARCVSLAADHVLFNVAGDLAINSDLAPIYPAIAKLKGLLPKQYGLPDGETAEWYYAQLEQSAKQVTLKCSCGSSSGNPAPGESDDDGAEGEGRSEIEIQRIIKQVADEVRDHARGRGNVPEGWQRWADAVLSPPKVRWQDKLARACRGAVSWRAGAVDYRHTHISRRQPGIGFGPGRPMLPALRAPVPTIWVAVDTSGSMGQEELTIALREVKGILALAGVAVTFIACDAAVHSVKPVRSWQELPKLLIGGGGTSFVPIFEELTKGGRKRADVLIICTDGDGECPVEPPNGIKVVWLLTGKCRRKPCAWGEQIEMDD